jgi:tRNA(fMet)-specific endonuclease VapC
MYLLDTNACIDFLVGRSTRLADRMGDAFGRLAVSTITVAELQVGSKTSQDAEGDKRRLDAFLAGVDVLPFDEAAAATYGTIARQIGVRRQSFDRLIAAHALSLGLTVVTRNETDFADVPGLKTENWAG